MKCDFVDFSFPAELMLAFMLVVKHNLMLYNILAMAMMREDALQTKMLDWDEICSIYHNQMQQDFPKDEIKPLWMIKRLFDDGRYFAYAMCDKNCIVAYALYVSASDNICLLDYLAVDGSMRGNGIGSKFLDSMKECLKDIKCVVIEIERISASKDESEAIVRKKRKSFYLKNGGMETGVFSSVAGVDYEILCLPITKKVSGDEAHDAMCAVYGMFLPSDKFYVGRQ